LQIKRLLDKLRSRIPGVTLRTTFIVGFPGETDADVELLANFIQEVEFDHLGVFAYSQEEGTIAGARLDQVPLRIREERRNYLMSLQRPISRRRNQALIGQTVDVLLEQPWPAGGGMIGRGRRDAPDVDGLVYVRDTQAKSGSILQVDIQAAKDYDLMGVPHR
jgi:ribosomal protein S12 methylthiotransferase